MNILSNTDHQTKIPPHLNGKVERTQQTDKSEFLSLVDLSDPDLNLNTLAFEWQEFCNKKRQHFL